MNLLQLLLGHAANLCTRAELDLDTVEALGRLVVRCGEGAPREVLDSVLDLMLNLVLNSGLCTEMQLWLVSLRDLVLLDTTEEDRNKLRLEYASPVEQLVDLLYSCGDFSNQAAILEILIRY